MKNKIKTKDITEISVLAAILYAIYFLGSFFMYIELTNFIILLYGISLNRKKAWFSVLIFCFLVILTKGFGLWSIMYFVIFPQYSLIYSFVSKLTKKIYIYGIVGFILSFLSGTFIMIPYWISAGISGKALLIQLILGFQVSLGSGICTLIATIFLLKPISKILKNV